MLCPLCTWVKFFLHKGMGQRYEKGHQTCTWASSEKGMVIIHIIFKPKNDVIQDVCECHSLTQLTKNVLTFDTEVLRQLLHSLHYFQLCQKV